MTQAERFWDKRANEYDRNEDEYEQRYKQIVENTKRHLHASDVVLDYACGTGIIGNEIADHVKQVHGNDISSRMIDVARREAGERRIENATYAQATIFDERYEEASFDVICAFNILHLLEDADKVMRRIHELLTPGGLLISATPCMGERRSFFGIVLFLLGKIGVVPYTRQFRFSELEGLIVNGNFQIVETQDLRQTPPNYFVVAKRMART